MNKLMVLPAKEATEIRLVRIPEDFEEHEAYRHVVGIIAQVEEDKPGYTWEDVAAELEDHDFQVLDFVLGPHLD